MKPQAYKNLKADPIRWARHLRHNREWYQENKEAKKKYNKIYGAEYRKLCKTGN